MRKLLAIFGGFCLALISLYSYGATGCFAQADQGLRERAQAFWDARVREDWAVLYQYLPASARGEASVDDFTTWSKKNTPFRYLSFELEQVETAKDLGWVKVVSAAQVSGFTQLAPRKTESWQPWQKTDGSWIPVPAKELADVPSRPPSMRPAEEEANLTKRADDFWQAKEQEQWGLIYAYCDPEFRKTVSQEEFLGKKSRYIYVTHSVDWVEVTGDTAKVMVTYLTRPSDPHLSKAEPVGDAAVEEWIKIEGVWYRSIQNKSLGGS